MKDILIEHTGIDRSKIQVLYNGVVSEPYRIEEVTNIRESLLQGEKYLVMSACRMMPWKGIEYLIEACREFPESTRLVLIGDGPVREKLEKMAAGTGIRFLGKMSHRDVQMHMRAADVYVMPSLFENFPLAALDCLVTQTPIVATNVGGTSEAITDERTGLFVEPRDLKAISEGVRRLLSDKELRDTMKENQRQAYRKFLWENVVDDYVKFYRRVME